MSWLWWRKPEPWTPLGDRLRAELEAMRARQPRKTVVQAEELVKNETFLGQTRAKYRLPWTDEASIDALLNWARENKIAAELEGQSVLLDWSKRD